MKIETKFNIGDTVYFLIDNALYKGVINEINIKVSYIQSVQIPWSDFKEIYEVKYINSSNVEVNKDISTDNLFKSATALVDKLMLDLEKREKEND